MDVTLLRSRPLFQIFIPNALCKSGVFFKTRTIQIRTTQNRTKQGPTVFLGI